MISGMFNGGWALGAMMGPVVAGALTQTLGFPWTITISAFLNLTLVRANGICQNISSVDEKIETLKIF